MTEEMSPFICRGLVQCSCVSRLYSKRLAIGVHIVDCRLLLLLVQWRVMTRRHSAVHVAAFNEISVRHREQQTTADTQTDTHCMALSLPLTLLQCCINWGRLHQLHDYFTGYILLTPAYTQKSHFCRTSLQLQFSAPVASESTELIRLVVRVFSWRGILSQRGVRGWMLRRRRHTDDVSAVRSDGGGSVRQDRLWLRWLLQGRHQRAARALFGQTVLQRACAWYTAR